MLRRPGLIAAAGLLSLLAGSSASADVTSEMSRYVGYTIYGTKTIVSWVSPDRTEKEDGFKGCEYGRYIVFSDNTYLRCTGYSYHYAYRPEALLLVRGNSFVMLVDDEAFEMAN